MIRHAIRIAPLMIFALSLFSGAALAADGLQYYFVRATGGMGETTTDYAPAGIDKEAMNFSLVWFKETGDNFAAGLEVTRAHFFTADEGELALNGIGFVFETHVFASWLKVQIGGDAYFGGESYEGARTVDDPLLGIRLGLGVEYEVVENLHLSLFWRNDYLTDEEEDFTAMTLNAGIRFDIDD